MSEWGDSFCKSACWNVSNNIAEGSELKFWKMTGDIFRCPRSETVPAPRGDERSFFSLGCRNEVILFLKVVVGMFPTRLLGVPIRNFEKCQEKFLDAHVPRPFPHRASMRGPQFFARMSEWGDSFLESACWNVSNKIARGSDSKFRKMPREIFRCPRSETVPARAGTRGCFLGRCPHNATPTSRFWPWF